ncbi:MAG: PAS domain S-box protein, partial [Sedimentisphaerales bacterium]|nr:PAS domain S-box protein [Sedimentisphaerales bacterium]
NIYEVFVLNTDGKIVASSDRSKIGLDRASDAYFLGAKSGPYIKDAYYSATTKQESMAVSAPVSDSKTGKFLGVIAARVTLNVLNEITTDTTGLGKTGEIYLVNKYGYMITPSRFIKDTFLKQKVDTQNTRDCFEDIKKFGRKVHEHKASLFADSRGVKVLGIHDHISRMQWCLCAEIDEKEALEPLAAMRTFCVIILSAALAIAWIVGIFVSKAITEPICRLRSSVEMISTGKLDTKIEVTSKDEVGSLATSFNDMAHKLNKSYLDLEEKVQHRTKELSSTNKSLEEEIAQRKRAQNVLKERIKELACFYKLSKLIEQPDVSLEDIFKQTTSLLQNAYQYPNLIRVRITFDGIHYHTDDFEKSESSQYAEIRVQGEKAGCIEVFYLGHKQSNEQRWFLEEEHNLLNAVAEHLGRMAGRARTAEKMQLFRELMNQSNDSVFVVDAKWGRFLDVNNRACESLGYAREELLDMTIKDIEESMPSDDLWKAHIDEVKKNGHLVLEGTHKRKDGKTFPIEANVKLVNQSDKIYVVSIVRDIAERKEAERALRKSEEKYRTLLENIPHKVFLKDRNSVYISCNENYASDLKIKAKEIVGKTDFDFYPDELTQKYKVDDIRIMETGNSEEIDEKYIQDGKEITVHTVKKPVKDEHGSVVGVLGIFWDVTELKHAQERQAQLMWELKAVNRELKDFAYVVSHDLKAPLRAIKTLANWLVNDYTDRLDEQGKEQLQLLESRIERMHNLIDGVLQYSRVGRIKEERDLVDLNELVPEVIDMIAPPGNIEVTIETKLPVIECEQTRIAQVFQNLLSNAVKYMDKPKGWIRIICVEEDGFWKFGISDDGPGIDEKHFEKIFQIFQTLLPRDEFESTGIGLTIVKKIVEMHNGRIWVESKLGEGSTFFFTLPKQELGSKNEKLQAGVVS